MKALTLWQPWASLCVLQRTPRLEERHRIEGGSLSCLYCNRTFTFNMMRDQGPHECSCTEATAARAEAALPIKTIETRSWAAPNSLIGQRIAIHAAKRKPVSVYLGAGLWCETWWDSVGHADDCECDAGEIAPTCWRLGTPHPALVRDGRLVTRLPLGAVVGTAVLADCVPMVQFHSRGPGHQPEPISTPFPYPNPPCLVINAEGSSLRIHRGHGTGIVDDVTDQTPFGWFEPGRWAWLLEDVEPFRKPAPAIGRQGIWEWSHG